MTSQGLRRRQNKNKKQKKLTDAELLALLEKSDSDYSTESEVSESGLLVNINSNEPIDYFNIMAPDDFFGMLYMRANNHAIGLIALGSDNEPRIARWFDVTPREMRIFLGLLFHMDTI